MKGNGHFRKIAGNNPGRSVFDLSYVETFTCEMGQIIPVMVDEVVPGDKFSIGVQQLLRMQPLVAPVMHEMYVRTYYFFCPNRLTMDEKEWEIYITGGPDGDGTDGEGGPVITEPRWTPSSTAVGSLWDYFGFPIGVTPTGRLPTHLPVRAYNLIYNEYLRDQNLIDPVDIETSEVIHKCGGIVTGKPK